MADAGSATEMVPAHEQAQVESLVSAGSPATLTTLAPADQGATTTGTHGCGVSTPCAALLALATCGFVSDLHMPNAPMLLVGTLWRIVATPLSSSCVSTPVMLNVAGLRPCVHWSVAP